MRPPVIIPGGTAVFRDPDEVTGRGRTLVKAAAMAAVGALQKVEEVVEGEPTDHKETSEEKEAREARNAVAIAGLDLTWQESLRLLELRQATVVASLASWTLNRPLPTMDSIGELEGDLYDALDAAIGGITNIGQTNFEVSPPTDQSTPSGPSSVSAGHLREATQESPSTLSQRNATDPSNGESSSPESPSTSTSIPPVASLTGI